MVPACRPLLVPLFAAVLLAGLVAPLAAAPALGPQIQVNVSTRDVNTFPQVVWAEESTSTVYARVITP